MFKELDILEIIKKFENSPSGTLLTQVADSPTIWLQVAIQANPTRWLQVAIQAKIKINRLMIRDVCKSKI